ncbi:Hypothetical predicted protein [Octopus vulgaris]|uniref:Uncharacterized protein n=1 Tax=Octopus vulgaris TaxID=6645 RepID=A0AA36B4C9_OCTVU|nr:Hypothetical predicted protein [Octopus vulgaris]
MVGRPPDSSNKACGPVDESRRSQMEKPGTQGNDDTCPASNTTTEDQRGAMAARKERHPGIDGKQEMRENDCNFICYFIKRGENSQCHRCDIFLTIRYQ